MTNVLFMGTPDFAVPSLRLILERSFRVVAVVTAPDKPAGRGLKMNQSAVKQAAVAAGLPVLQPVSLKDPAFAEQVRTLAPDVIVVVAFRILPREVFTIPPLGAFNLHASLLPKFRGAAPINWAIIRGERETGVTTFLLREQVDTGNVLLQARVPIGEETTAGELHDVLADVGAEIVVHTLRLLETGAARPRAQDDRAASGAPRIFRADCRIPWSRPAREVHDFIRGLSPSPCAFTVHGTTQLRVYRSAVASGAAELPPGTVTCSGGAISVACGTGAVELTELQAEGRKRMSAPEFLRGYQFAQHELLT